MDCEETDVFLQMHGLGVDREEHQVRRSGIVEGNNLVERAQAPSFTRFDDVEDSLFLFYASPSIVELASAFLENDLVMFGYDELRLEQHQGNQDAVLQAGASRDETLS